MTALAMRCAPHYIHSQWGHDFFGQVGDGSSNTADKPAPVAVCTVEGCSTGMNELVGVVEVTCGGWHTCALLSDGRGRCWGSGSSGQLGSGDTVDLHVASAFVLNSTSGVLTNIAHLAATGRHHTCATMATGTAVCFGSDVYVVPAPRAAIVPMYLLSMI